MINKKTFNKNVTSQMKAIALLLMLVHHLSKMNGSWWFMQTYVIFVICFPIFAKSLHYKMVCIPLLIVSVLCFQPIATDIRKYSDAVHYVLHYFPLFYSGMIARKISLFDLLVEKQWWFKLFLIVVLVVARFATGWNILNIGLIVAMIMILVDVQEYITGRVLKVLNFLGKMGSLAKACG